MNRPKPIPPHELPGRPSLKRVDEMIESWRGVPSKKVPKVVKQLDAMLDVCHATQEVNRKLIEDNGKLTADNTELARLVAHADIEIDLTRQFYGRMAERFVERSLDENLCDMALRDGVVRLIRDMRMERECASADRFKESGNGQDRSSGGGGAVPGEAIEQAGGGGSEPGA